MPYMTADQCAELHRCFLKDLTAEMKKHADADIIVAYTGGEPVFLRKLFGKRTVFIEQRGEDLGAKMENAIADVCAMGYRRVVLTGSDIPELRAKSVNNAFDMLDSSDVVIGATEDGGYYLIGMKKALHAAFDVKLYGVSTVYEETFASMQKAGLKVSAADKYSDIDTPEDLAGYRSRMRKDAALRKTATGRYLAEQAKVSVIIPVYNEEKSIRGLMDQLRPYKEDAEIIFVDGGSTDNTAAIIGNEFRLVRSRKGRGVQLNTGVEASSGDILFFLHCDSTLPDGFLKQIRQVMTKNDWGCFGIKFRSSNFFMLTNRIISNHRACVRRLPFGDQGIFIDRDLFFREGKFREMPVMEDYDFSLRLRKDGKRPGITRHRIITSARRYGRGTRAILSTEFHMWNLRRLFRKGLSAEELSRRYEDIR
jgi:rSAM/selenodomain-associated transferase 2/rSAM/selenodomain-associated transferase 1